MRTKVRDETWATWETLVFFCIVVLILFFVGRGYPSLTQAGIYVVVFLTGCAVVLSIALLQGDWAEGVLRSLVYCPVCEKCLPITPANQAPEYINGAEVPMDEFLGFLKRHSGCRSLIKISILLGPWRRRRKPADDPLKDEFYLAKGNGKLFLINRARFDINKPLAYEVFPLFSRKTPGRCIAWFWLK